MTMIPLYKKEDILEAISKEGLIRDAWGYKTPYCIFVFVDGMEKDGIWKQYPTPLTGYEKAWWNKNCIERVVYFLLEGYVGNLSRLQYQLNNPTSQTIILDD